MPSSLADHYPTIDPALQVAPTLMVGNRWLWNRTDAIPDHLLPLNGQVVANADVDYPELWSVRALTTLIASFDDGAKTLTLKNYNGQSRFARAGVTPGVEQNDATAVNGLRIIAGTGTSLYSNNGSVRGMRHGDNNWQSGTNGGRPNVLQGDPETRPINVSEVWCVIAKPWVVSGDVTINQTMPPKGAIATPDPNEWPSTEDVAQSSLNKATYRWYSFGGGSWSAPPSFTPTRDMRMLATFTATAWRSSAGWLGWQPSITGGTWIGAQPVCFSYTNWANGHRTLTPGLGIIAVTKGVVATPVYTNPVAGTVSDGNDFFSVTLAEL